MASGKLWDNLGSTTFVTTKGDADKTRLSKRGEWRRRIAESSDDELDFLSSSSRSDDVEQLTAAKSKLKTKKQPGKAVIQGQEADCRPDHPPKRKLPNFKKITNAAPGGTSTSRGGTSNATHKAPKQTKSYGILATLHDNENERLSGPSSDKDSFDGSTYASISPQQRARKFPGLTLSPLRSGDQSDSPHADTPRGSMNGAISYKRSKPLHNKAFPYNSDAHDRSIPTSRHATRNQGSETSDSSEATPRAKHPKNGLRRFPILDPLSISDPAVPELDGGKGKAPFKGATNHDSSQIHRKTVSDKTTPRKNRKSRYPFRSALSSPVYQPAQDSAIAAGEDADDESPKRKPQLRPFPMTASKLKAADRAPRDTLTHTQHAYPDNDRNISFPSDLEMLEDDSLFMGESADPSSLCPFCDEKLPANPSPFYRTLLETARLKAHPDPRPTNPRGLKALMGIYVASCKRHRFEAHQIPEAIAKGWPTNIDFGKVRERVERLSGDLAKLVRDEGNAREDSVYWTTVMNEVRKLGSRAASGVKGQFESFEKTQPGYYGELGSMILHQTLYNIFPPSSLDPMSITPLTPQEFIQRILVPEAALTLIMQDTGQDRAKAVQTMRESAGYGVAMFPDTSEGPEVGAGEDIVLERARARRRELDDEERREDLLRSGDSVDESRIHIKGTKRPKMLNSATTTDIEETATARSRIKRKKAGSRTDVESGPDVHFLRATSAYKSTAAVLSNYATDPSPPQSSHPPPSPSRARTTTGFPWTSSPEHTPTRNSRPEPRPLRVKPVSSNPRDGSRELSASVALESGAASSAPNSQGMPAGRSMSAPIDVDDLQMIDIVDAPTPSPFEQHPPILADGAAGRVPGSSDAKELGGEHDPPKPKPKPRRRIAERNASVDRCPPGPHDPVAPSRDRNQWSDSSVEIIEQPPPNHDRLAWRGPPSRATTRPNDNTGHIPTRARRPPASTNTSGSSSPKHERHDWLMNDSSD